MATSRGWRLSDVECSPLPELIKMATSNPPRRRKKSGRGKWDGLW